MEKDSKVLAEVSTISGLRKDGTKGARKAKRRADVDRSLDEPGAALIGIEQAMWISISAEMRKEQLDALDERYHYLVDELYNSANLCVERYKAYQKSHTSWRRTLIIGTGILAVINVLGASESQALKAALQGALPLIAAVFAVVLAVLANLESFNNSPERARGYRESRELFLDGAREFDRRWDVYVRPLGDSPEACLNASELYRQVVAKDREQRAKFSELMKTESKNPGGRGQ